MVELRPPPAIIYRRLGLSFKKSTINQFINYKISTIMMSCNRLTTIMSLMLAVVDADVLTVPIRKKAFDRPITRTQKMVSEVHQKYLDEKYESLL